MRVVRSAVFVSAVVALASCGDTRTIPPPPTSSARLTSVSVAPENSTLEKGLTVDFTATAHYSDGSTKEVTAQATWRSSATEFSTISALGTARAVEVGTSSISARFENHSGETDLTVVSAGLVTIAINPPEGNAGVGTMPQFRAVGSFRDNRTEDITAAVDWTSSNPAIATIAAGGVATAISQGTTTLTATDRATGISAQAMLHVTGAPLTSIRVDPSMAVVPLGATRQYIATGTYADGMMQDITTMVQWSSTSSRTATIGNSAADKGRVSTHAIGLTTVTATDPATGVSASATLTVTTPAIMTLTVSPRRAQITTQDTQQFEAMARYSDGSLQDVTRQVNWSSANMAIATISNVSASRGAATALSVGTTTISANHVVSGVSSDASGGSGILQVLPPQLVSIAVIPLTVQTPLGATTQFTATGIYSDSTNRNLTNAVLWRSSNSGVATISNAAMSIGLATTVATGTTSISVVDPATGISSDDSMRSAVLTVTPAELVSIRVTPPTAALVVGAQQQFEAMGSFSDGTMVSLTNQVTWRSSAAVVSISSTAPTPGRATANAIGMATIAAFDAASTISSDDSNESATVLVSEASLLSITVTPASASIPVSAEQPFVAMGSYNNGSMADITDSVMWTSSAPTIATVSNVAGRRGRASALAAGMATISATEPVSGISSETSMTSATLNVSAVTLTSVAVQPTVQTIATNATFQLTAVGTFSDNSTFEVTPSVNWMSANPAVATVSNTAGSVGEVRGVAVGSTMVSATHVASGVSSDTSNQSAMITVDNPGLFFDDFEDGNFNGWTTGTGTYTRTVATNTGGDNTSSSLMMTGGSSGHYNGLIHTLPSVQPTYISLWVRSNSTSTADGYFVIGDSATETNQGIIFYHFAAGATQYVYDGTSRRGETPYVANQWYHLEFRNINWTSKTYEFWIDGVRRDASVTFRTTSSTSMDVIHLYNFTSGTAWWDEILLR